MPTIYDWSLTPGDNATADQDVNWAEGQFPSTVNDSARQMMARQAEWLKDNGILTAAGSANTITVATGSQVTTPPHGMTIAFKANATNTAAVTLSINGGTGLKLRKIFAGDSDATDLDAGDITAKGIYVAHFDSGANSGAGAWVLINPTNLVEMQSVISNNLNNAPTKDTPVDADAVVITDSADSGKTKRVLWSRIKAVLSLTFLPLAGGTMAGEIISRAANSYRLANGNGAAVILRKDGSNFYLLLTDTWDGDFNDLRPLQIALSDGSVVFARPRTSRAPTDASDLTQKSYVDGGDSANASAAAAAQGTANTARTEAAAAQTAANSANSNANSRLIADSATHGGFASADITRPYMRGSGGTVVELARKADLPNVQSIVAGIGANGIGSYAFLAYVPGNQRNPGDRIGASDLRWTNADGDQSGTPNGSWECCGYLPASGAGADRATLWRRYA